MDKHGFLVDNHGRTINYLRLAVTDRCNLRCLYCMPEEGIDWIAREDLLTFPEMLAVSKLLVGMGIEKIRITGGEPFVRKGTVEFLYDLSKLDGLRTLTLTTNGVLTAPIVPEFRQLGIQTVNLSLDTLDRTRFFAITRRDELPAVLQTLDQLLFHGIRVKINCVVMAGKNTQDIGPLAALTKDLDIDVRYIEEMPFNGSAEGHAGGHWSYQDIVQHLQSAYPEMHRLPEEPYATSMNFAIPGHKGRVGVIAAYSRSFCGTCNRIRITPQGVLKTCLYDNGVLNVRDMIRTGNATLENAIREKLGGRFVDGREAEEQSYGRQGVHESMAAIGG